jgi:hypothetical protein
MVLNNQTINQTINHHHDILNDFIHSFAIV